MAASTDILLDADIRDWVLLPILIVMFVVSFLRANVAALLETPAKVTMKSTQEQQLVRRAQFLREHGHHISPESFARKKHFLCDADKGVLAVRAKHDIEAKKANPMANNPAMDPSMMIGMVKKQMSMVIPQIALMSFKGMLQRGIELDTLDPSYVSSLSWYFLNVMGLRGLLFILLGDGNAADDAAIMQSQMAPAASGAAMDVGKVFTSERENLQLVKHAWTCAEAEERALDILRARREARRSNDTARQANTAATTTSTTTNNTTGNKKSQ